MRCSAETLHEFHIAFVALCRVHLIGLQARLSEVEQSPAEVEAEPSWRSARVVPYSLSPKVNRSVPAQSSGG